MKLILVGLALLQFASAQPVGPTSAFYEELNFRRALYAKEHNIANMNYIYYKESMEGIMIEEVKKDDGCPKSRIINKGDVEIFLDASLKNQTMRDALFVAGRSLVATWSTRCNGKNLFHFVLDVPRHPAIYGAPGSQCSKGTHVIDRSLCLVHDDSSFEEQVPATAENLVDPLAEIRADYEEYKEVERERKAKEQFVEFIARKAKEQIKPKYGRKSVYRTKSNIVAIDPWRPCRPRRPDIFKDIFGIRVDTTIPDLPNIEVAERNTVLVERQPLYDLGCENE